MSNIDLISREALKKAYFNAINKSSIGEVSIIDLIDNAPPVEPQKIVTIPPELIEKLASCVVDIVGNIDWEKAIEAYKARPQGNVAYLCDGDNCPTEKASCEHGGPCRHTTNIEHAINFRRVHDTDKFYEVENVMRIEGQENQ